MLESRNCYVNYGRIEALRGVSISLGKGDFVLVLGPNGAGKTTLMKALSGLLPLRSGQVLLNGADISQLPPSKRLKLGISLVPEGRGRLPGLTVRENLHLGWKSASAQNRTSEKDDLAFVLDLFPRLQERMDQDCATLSGGEMQMLAIARALLAKPTALLLDEPSLGLAPKAIAAVYEILAKLVETGLSIILVEQKFIPIESTISRTVVLQNGRAAIDQAGRLDSRALTEVYFGGLPA